MYVIIEESIDDSTRSVVSPRMSKDGMPPDKGNTTQVIVQLQEV